MRSKYNLTGNVVEEIKKKHAFVWRLNDTFYAVNRNECKKVAEGSQLMYHYNEYVQSEKGMNFGDVKAHASAYITGGDAATEATDEVFSGLDVDCEDDLNDQLTNYVVAFSNINDKMPPLAFSIEQSKE